MIWNSKSRLPVREQASLFLSWMTMLMVFIATLFLVGSLALTNLISSWNKTISGSMTIQIPTYTVQGENRGDDIQKDIDTTLSLLKQTPGVENVRLLDEQQMTELMEPWLGVSEKISELPLPALLDVSLDTHQPFNFVDFKNQLYEVAPLVQVDSHRVWLSHLIETAKAIQNMIAFILFLLILTTSFTVIYTTSASLALQEPVIKLLHMMGARDTIIAFQYAAFNFLKSLAGGLSGFLLALPIIWIASTLFNPIQDPLFSEAQLSAKQIYLVLSIPVLAALFSFFAAFLTIIKKLGRLV